ncbi:Telomerase protein component 1 [Ceratocystis pirilliformis]|uniref:phosphatidylinositol-3,4,5-trisphosphate 3-phosphatase n=1 Tax=Ceratocystis pirilliformis TaxID=259994 RepID=A0ABR3ZII8_9PEZI
MSTHPVSIQSPVSPSALSTSPTSVSATQPIRNIRSHTQQHRVDPQIPSQSYPESHTHTGVQSRAASKALTLRPVSFFSRSWAAFEKTVTFILTHSELTRSMAPFLRRIVAGPRVMHEESGLDLCYVTPQLLVTSGPAQDVFKSSYRTPLPQLLAFLKSRHHENWAIWEFRAEGTGYPDEAVENRIHHYPWPDHQPPPFRLVPLMMASMRNWLKEDCRETIDTDAVESTSLSKSDLPDDCPAANGRVVVIHCKAGKGRSGSVACSYLISECGWEVQQALDRFTSRRMKAGYGEGVSIPSQLRWIDYVDRWTRGGKKYTDRAIEILEIRTWGLRPGVKLEVKSYVNGGKEIKVVHSFKRDERVVVDHLERVDKAGFRPKPSSLDGFTRSHVIPRTSHPGGSSGTAWQEYNQKTSRTWFGAAFGNFSFFQALASSFTSKSESASIISSPDDSIISQASQANSRSSAEDKAQQNGPAVIFRPETPIRIANNDVQVSLERRSFTPSPLPFNAMTSLAYAWFNAFFEGDGESGVFEVPWEAMDGVRGSSAKGSRALDRMEVVWRVARDGDASIMSENIEEPAMGEKVPEMEPAIWSNTVDSESKLAVHITAELVDPLQSVKTADPDGKPLKEISVVNL